MKRNNSKIISGKKKINQHWCRRTAKMCWFHRL